MKSGIYLVLFAVAASVSNQDLYLVCMKALFDKMTFVVKLRVLGKTEACPTENYLAYFVK